jgi:hypothetical protein
MSGQATKIINATTAVNINQGRRHAKRLGSAAGLEARAATRMKESHRRHHAWHLSSKIAA